MDRRGPPLKSQVYGQYLMSGKILIINLHYHLLYMKLQLSTQAFDFVFCYIKYIAIIIDDDGDDDDDILKKILWIAFNNWIENLK